MIVPSKADLPLVSVIVPTYNHGSFIGPALESLFRQIYPEEKREIIIVDDGSTDNTPELLKKFGQEIFYIRQQHRGIASARNAGISRAKGEIITFLDSDDLWYEERLLKVVERFIENPCAALVYHPIELIDIGGKTIKKNFYAAFGYEAGLSGWVGNEMASGKIFSGGSSFAFRKDIIDKVSPLPEDIRRGIDYYMTVTSSCYGPAEYIPQILGKYRLHESNVTLFAGVDDRRTLTEINKDFAHTRQRVVEDISNRRNACAYKLDVTILRRIQAKESIFYHVLEGRRLEAVKWIAAAFNGRPSVKEVMRGLEVTFMVLFVPAFLYPRILSIYQLFKRSSIIANFLS